MIAAGAVAGVLVAGLLGFAVWESAGGRPYAELASCRDVLPVQVVDTVPGADGARAEGEFVTMDEQEWYSDDAELEEAGYIGQLSCYVSDDGEEWGLVVNASLFDHERSREYFEDTVQEMEDRIGDLDRGRDDEDVLEWARTPAGDGGIVTLHDYDGDRSAVAAFQDVNVQVYVHYTVPGDVDDAEAMEFMEDFSGQLRRRLSRTSERA
ncbi:hypothetical protein ABZ249_06345 [Nocardiopsis sp. NPDC006139]|uniref:hypothetical protein n=1 Tax=Nocardiopsis sp. NPDC006139 TaxID=3154578 RepID=UPI0033AFC80D